MEGIEGLAILLAVLVVVFTLFMFFVRECESRGVDRGSGHPPGRPRGRLCHRLQRLVQGEAVQGAAGQLIARSRSKIFRIHRTLAARL